MNVIASAVSIPHNISMEHSEMNIDKELATCIIHVAICRLCSWAKVIMWYIKESEVK